MSEKWGLGLNLGYSIYRKTNTEIFSVLEYAVTGSYEIEKPWSLELIAGAQTWISSGQGTGLLVGLNGKHTFKEKQFGLVDHVVAGYSAVFQNQAYHLVRLGVGLKF
jgi:hypothetical protein